VQNIALLKPLSDRQGLAAAARGFVRRSKGVKGLKKYVYQELVPTNTF